MLNGRLVVHQPSFEQAVEEAMKMAVDTATSAESGVLVARFQFKLLTQEEFIEARVR